jgi:hypothetical protein
MPGEVYQFEVNVLPEPIKHKLSHHRIAYLMQAIMNPSVQIGHLVDVASQFIFVRTGYIKYLRWSENYLVLSVWSDNP